MSKTTNLSALSDVVKVTSGFTQLDNESGYNGLIIGANDSTGTHIVSEASGLNIYSGVVGAGNKRMGIDSAGRVTMPHQPSFSGYSGSSVIVVPVHPGTALIPTTLHNIGNHWNGDRFTCPVTGVYEVHTGFMKNSTSSNAVHVDISVNGGGAYDLRRVRIWEGNGYYYASNTFQIYLSANDYIQWWMFGDGNPEIYPVHSSFYIKLVG